MPVISIVQFINKTNIFKYRNKDLAYNEVVKYSKFQYFNIGANVKWKYQPWSLVYFVT